MHKTKIWNNHKYSIFIFIYLLIDFLLHTPVVLDVDVWNTTSYGITYSMVGFNSRALVGTILSFFSIGKYILSVYLFVISSELILIILTSILLGRLIHQAKDLIKYTTIILIILFIASPANITFLFHKYNFATLDLYLLIWTLISIILLESKRLKYLVPIISFICIATHQMYVFTYFTITLVALIIKINQSKQRKAYIGILVGYLLVTVLAFSYFQFFKPSLQIGNPLDAYHYLQARTTYPISHEMIETEYYHDIAYHIDVYVMKDLAKRICIGLIIIILTSPLSIIIYCLLSKAYIVCKCKSEKLLLLLVMLIPVFHLPLFILTIDWGRWFASIFICLFGSVFYLIHSCFIPIIESLSGFETKVHSNKALIFIMAISMIFIASLGYFEAPGQLALATNVYESLAEAIESITKLLMS